MHRTHAICIFFLLVSLITKYIVCVAFISKFPVHIFWVKLSNTKFIISNDIIQIQTFLSVFVPHYQCKAHGMRVTITDAYTSHSGEKNEVLCSSWYWIFFFDLCVTHCVVRLVLICICLLFKSKAKSEVQKIKGKGIQVKSAEMINKQQNIRVFVAFLLLTFINFTNAVDLFGKFYWFFFAVFFNLSAFIFEWMASRNCDELDWYTC